GPARRGDRAAVQGRAARRGRGRDRPPGPRHLRRHQQQGVAERAAPARSRRAAAAERRPARLLLAARALCKRCRARGDRGAHPGCVKIAGSMAEPARAAPPSDVPALDFERPVIELERKIEELVRVSGGAPELRPHIGLPDARARELQQEIFADLSPWQKVQLSRHPARPYTQDYIDRLFPGFIELHGDRRFADDPAIIAGFGTFDGTPVMVVGHQKGRTTKEKQRRNFGQPKPEGYRKALRLMELAGRTGRPIICLIDTQGAYPGVDAEERGQAEAIAKNLEVMAGLPVPIVCAVIGEGGSGGALGIGVANRILMLEYATYSVISPEGCASILWRDDTKKPEAA